MAGVERRLVTVVFADLTGYTELCERLDPEAVHAVVLPAMERLRSVVEARGGTTSAIAGDGFSATFGLPRMHRDDAVRAVTTALALQPAIDEINASNPGVELPRVHVGVNSGEVVVTATPEERGGFAMSGTAINLAARLCSLAAPGEVLVGPATRELIGAKVTFGPTTARAVKGLAEPVEIAAAIGVSASAESDRLFVDRDGERRALLATWEDVQTTGASALVVISGDVGQGKSRLGREIAHLIPEARLVAAAATPHGLTRPLGPLLDVVIALVSSEAADVATVVRDVSLACQDAGIAAEVVPELLRFLRPSEESAPPGAVEAAGRAAGALLAGVARATPLVVVLDDLQWAGEELLAFLAEIELSPLPGPVLVVGLTRPGTAVPGSLVELSSIPREHLARLLRHLIEAEPGDEVEEGFLDRSAGNPLFLEELVRVVTASGQLHRVGGRAELLDTSTLSNVPQTLRQVVAAALDSLPVDERRVLIELSVGGSVTWDVIAPDAQSEIASLVARGLLQPRAHSTIPGATEYVMKHGLIRDVAYELLSRRRRAELHRLLATSLREWGRGGVAATVAWHWEQAARHGAAAGEPPEVIDATVREAVAALHGAAISSFAYSAAAAADAATRAQEVLDLAPGAVPPDIRAAVALLRARASVDMLAYDHAFEAADAALAAASDDPQVRAEVALLKGTALSDQSRVAEARPLLEDALAGYEALGDDRGRGRALQGLAWTRRYEDFLVFCADLAAAYEVVAASGDRALQVRLACELAYNQVSIGGPGFEHWRELALDLVDHADLRGRSELIRVDTWLAWQRGDWQRSIELARSAGAVAADCGQHWVLADAQIVEAHALASLGRYEASIELAIGCESTARRRGLERMTALARIPQALAMNADDGRPVLEEVRSALESLGALLDTTDVELGLATLDARVGRFAEAAVHASTAAGWMSANQFELYELGPRLLDARCRLAAGEDVAAAANVLAADASARGGTRHALVARATGYQSRLLARSDPEEWVPAAHGSDPECRAVVLETSALDAARRGRSDEAVSYRDAAVAAWLELGPSAWADRAAGLLASG